MFTYCRSAQLCLDPHLIQAYTASNGLLMSEHTTIDSPKPPELKEIEIKQEESKTVAMTTRKPSRRGRKPTKVDTKTKLERSRQSARECRARKKLRYQYLEELVSSREKAIYALREELETYKEHCQDLDEGHIPKALKDRLQDSAGRLTAQ